MKKLFYIFGLSTLFLAGCSSECDWETHSTIREKEKIVDRANRLFISTDNKDWQGVTECFTDSVLLDMTSLVGGDPALVASKSIIDAWDKGLSALKSVHHQSGNFLVEINNDEADLFCYAIATHYLPNRTTKNTRTFVGSYDMHLIKKDDDWKINKFKFNLKYIDGNLELEKDL